MIKHLFPNHRPSKAVNSVKVLNLIDPEIKQISGWEKWLWGRRRVRVGVPPKLIIHECVYLPSISRQKAENSATLTVLQRIPFQRNEILIAANVRSDGGNGDKTIVDVYSVFISDIEGKLSNIIDKGYEITHIHPLDTEGLAISKVSFQNGAIKGGTFIPESRVQKAAGLILVVGLLVVVISVNQGNQKTISALSDYNSYQVSFLSRFMEKQKKIALSKQQSAVINQFSGKPDSYSYLVQFYNKLPPSIDVIRLSITGSRIEFSGLSRNAQLSIEKIRSVSAFKNVRFIGLPQNKNDLELFKVVLSAVSVE